MKDKIPEPWNWCNKCQCEVAEVRDFGNYVEMTCGHYKRKMPLKTYQPPKERK